MKKPDGWRREPARHALASKGIETGRTKKQSNVKSLSLPTAALKSGTPAVRDDQKEAAIDMILANALETGGSKAKAIQLIEDDSWLQCEVQKVAESEADGVLQRKALQGELLQTLRRNPPVSDEEGD